MNGERPPVRAIWFKFFGQRYLIGGNLRAECAPDERAVWLDFLCLANAGDGRFDCAKRDALAGQLLITRELLDRAIGKFAEAGRLAVEFDERERKEVFTITKWDYYQAPAKAHKKGGADGDAESPSPLPSSSSERKKERKIERKRGGEIASRDFPPKTKKTIRNSPPLEENLISKNTDAGRVPCDVPPNVPPNDTGGELIEDETPKGLPFKIGDELRDLRREHNDLIRLSRDEKQMGRWQENRVSVLKRAAVVRRRYDQVKADAK